MIFHDWRPSAGMRYCIRCGLIQKSGIKTGYRRATAQELEHSIDILRNWLHDAEMQKSSVESPMSKDEANVEIQDYKNQIKQVQQFLGLEAE
jgi:hypothetical protein